MITVVPKNLIGKISVGLITAAPFLFISGGILSNTLYRNIPSGNTIAEDLAARPVLAITMLLASVSGVAAFALGLTSFIKQKERALLIFIPIILGGLLTFMLLGELIFTH